MTTKCLMPNNEKFSNIPNDTTYKEKAIGTFSVPKLFIETEEAQLKSHSNSEIKTISDHNKQVSKYYVKRGQNSKPISSFINLRQSYLLRRNQIQ